MSESEDMNPSDLGNTITADSSESSKDSETELVASGDGSSAITGNDSGSSTAVKNTELVAGGDGSCAITKKDFSVPTTLKEDGSFADADTIDAVMESTSGDLAGGPSDKETKKERLTEEYKISSVGEGDAVQAAFLTIIKDKDSVDVVAVEKSVANVDSVTDVTNDIPEQTVVSEKVKSHSSDYSESLDSVVRDSLVENEQDVSSEQWSDLSHTSPGCFTEQAEVKIHAVIISGKQASDHTEQADMNTQDVTLGKQASDTSPECVAEQADMNTQVVTLGKQATDNSPECVAEQADMNTQDVTLGKQESDNSPECVAEQADMNTQVVTLGKQATDNSPECVAEHVEVKTKDDTGPKIPKEYEPLWGLLSQIPKKAQRGLLMQCDLILTCVHADENFIALGTNIGIVFLFDRKKQTLERLKSESSSDVVTCVQLHHGIDYQLAVGMSSGAICVFQLPSMMTGLNKQLQRFYVKNMHRSYLTCIEWSTNGMRLFSGDKLGAVVVTEVDFYQGQCKSDELISETHTAIVQLHYDHKVLLVSTKQRSLICRLDEGNKICQVGQKERKIEGGFGACFIPGLCKTSDAQLYAARQGLRLWKADINGTVLNTSIFKDLTSAPVTEIEVVRAERLMKTGDTQFGKLHIYCETLLLTWTSTCILIVDPSSNSVVACLDKAGYIIDVCVHQDEIFVLRRNTENDLIRLAFKREVIPKVHHVLLSELQSSSSPDSLLTSVTGQLTSRTRTSPEDEKPSKNVSPKAFIKKNIFGKLNKFLDLGSDSGRTLAQHGEVSVKQLIDDIPSSDGENSDMGSSKSPDLPPVIKLKSPELPSLQIYTSSTGSPLSPSASEISVPSSSSTAVSLCGTTMDQTDTVLEGRQQNPSDTCLTESKETVSNSEHISLISQIVQVGNNQQDDSEDLVFSHKKKKHKKKKSKHVVGDFKKTEEDEISQSSDTSQTQVTSTDSLIYNTENHPVKELPSPDPTETLRIADEILKRTHELIQGHSPSESEEAHSVDDVSSKLTETSTDSQSTSTVSRPPDIPYAYNVQGSLPELDSSRYALKRLNEAAKSMSAKYDHTSPSSTESLDTNKSVSKSSSGLYSTSDASTEDFYKKYIPPVSPSTDSSLMSPQENPLSHPESEQASCPLSIPESGGSNTCSSAGEMNDGILRRLANSWSEISAPANIYSLVLSNSHIWFTDKSEHIYFSPINSAKGIVWRKASGSASQISVSRSGKLVWRLHKGKAYAGTKITAKRPEGMKWVEAVQDVAFISVDDSCAWYVKNNGTVMMQKGLSVERPCYRSVKVNCVYELKQIVCRDGIVWAVTNDYKLIYRRGITTQCMDGTDWDIVSMGPEGILCTNVALSDQGIGWALDVVGRVWFCTNVTRETPAGEGHWWQVPMSEYFVQDATAIDALRSLARKFDPQKLSYLLSTNRGGLIAAGSMGVWLCFEYKNIINVCRGNFLGYRWIDAQLMEMAPSTIWKTISACTADLDWGLVWAQQPNGELCAFSASTYQGSWVTPSPLFLSLHAGPTAVWGLDTSGQILVRAGMGPYCPSGANWSELDLSQLGDAQLVHMSCNRLYVWAVDCDGHVYHRIGAKAPQDQQLCPAWLPIDSFSDIAFTKVVVGPLDWMVWAIDNRRLAYVRVGITDEMPIGKEWIHVPGTQVMELALTKTGVWALNPNGEILFRYCISLDNLCGDYWKKLPGVFSHLSASPSDDLWAISTEGHLQHCHMKYVLRRQLSADPSLSRTISSGSEEGEWELV